MNREFVYTVEKYPTEQFTRLVYLCADHGERGLAELPSDRMNAFEALLNSKGAEGWDLVQTFFGEDGVVAIWKKEQGGVR